MVTLARHNRIERAAVRSITGHIPFVRLVDLVDGRLDREEQTMVDEHISSCDACAANRVWLEHVIELMRTDTSIDPPAHVVARAVDLFHARMPVARPAVR